MKNLIIINRYGLVLANEIVWCFGQELENVAEEARRVQKALGYICESTVIKNGKRMKFIKNYFFATLLPKDKTRTHFARVRGALKWIEQNPSDYYLVFPYCNGLVSPNKVRGKVKIVSR